MDKNVTYFKIFLGTFRKTKIVFQKKGSSIMFSFVYFGTLEENVFVEFIQNQLVDKVILLVILRT